MTDSVVFDDVTFAYPGAPVPAISHATFTLPEGALVLVAGPTGAGKSTLLRCINGLVPHFSGGSFSGRVVVEGRSTIDVAPRQLSDVVAFVPQNPGASFVLERVEDELAYAMENLGVPPATMRRRVEETLDLLNLDSLRGCVVDEISGGERQRVAIGAALTTQPRVLVLDEPTSQLDPQGAEDVLAALQRLVHDHAVTVVMAEHRLERVAGFADVAIGCRPVVPPVIGPPEEVLAELDLGPPVARLGAVLGWSPAPLTVRDARRHAASLPLPEAPPESQLGRNGLLGGTLIGAHNLHAAYTRTPVLHGIDFSVRAGEVVGLVGRNGAGKTTLLRALAGLHKPSRGEVEAGGNRVRTGIDVALCPQDPDSVLFKESVLDEVNATRRRGPLAASPEELVQLLGLSHLSRHHPRDISAGERLLVAVAAIAATGASVLLLDEPTRGLDAATKSGLRGFLRDHARSGGAVVVATHDVEFAAEVATRAAMLAAGEVVADGTPAEVLGDSVVFAPQTARVFGPRWLTPEQISRFVCNHARPPGSKANKKDGGPG